MILTPEELVIMRKWNLYLTKLMECEKTWKELLELRENTKLNHDSLPAKAGKIFGLATMKSNFMVATSRLLDYVRKYSSIEELFIELPAEEKGVSNARRK